MQARVRGISATHMVDTNIVALFASEIAEAGDVLDTSSRFIRVWW